DRPGRVHFGDRYRGARRVPAALPHRRHHPRARTKPRDRRDRPDRADDVEGRDHRRQPVRARRQGYLHRGGCAGSEDVKKDWRLLVSAAAMAASFLTGTDSSFWANDFRDSILKAEGDATLFDYADLHRSQTSLI